MSATDIRNLLNLFESIVLNELTDKVKQQQFERLKNETENSGTNVPDEKIRMYIDLWDEYSQGFPSQFKDITKLSLDQIIRLTRDADFKKYIRGKQSRFFTDQDPNPDLDTLYNKNNLTIMKGDLREKCITYGQGYSWCISRKDAQNMFYSYRMRMNEPMFYFVFDKDRPKTDIWHAVVIYINNQGIFNVATANNPGDVEMTWDQITQKQPKLNGLQNLFKHKPLSSDERSDYDKYKNSVTYETYNNFSLEEKYKYFNFGNVLTDRQQDLTPDDLIGVYAKLMPTEITNKTWNRLKNGDKRKIISDVLNENNNIDAGKFAINVLTNPWHMTGLPQEVIDKAHAKIASNAYNSYEYAKLILRNNNYNPELIPQEIIQGIASNAYHSYGYAELILINNNYNQKLIPQEIIQGIASNAYNSYEYAELILINNNYNQKLIPQEILTAIKK